jgi:glycosyltransferase involved in cell wall biosynthesis
VELGHHVNPPFPWIAFLGPDGSGKSSVINGVKERLAARRLGFDVIHWKPQVLRKAPDVPGGMVTDPHGKPQRGLAFSVLKMGFLVLEWGLAWPWMLRHLRAKNRILVSDRYYNDLIADPRRYRFGAPTAWARAAFGILPKPHRVIVLAGDAAQIHARKQEVTLEELERQLAAYRNLAAEIGGEAQVLDCCQPLEQVVDQAYEAVMDTLMARQPRHSILSARRSGVKPPAPNNASSVGGPSEAEAVSETARDRRRLRVLISAYACSPDRGAEANVGWNLVKQLSERNELWVLTRSINRNSIESSGKPWVKQIHWLYLDPPNLLSFWKRGRRGVPMFYVWWQFLARREAKRLMADQDFDLIHHVTIGTYLMPSPLSNLGPPLVFGPVGGDERTPPGLSSDFRWSGVWEERMREMVRSGLEHFNFLHHWHSAAAWTLAATPATESALRRMGIHRVSQLAQSATGDDTVAQFTAKHPGSKRKTDAAIHLVTACRLVHWKAVDLAVEAVREVRAGGLNVRLTVLEDGPERGHLERKVADLDLGGAVKFTGRLATLEQVYETIRTADALIHPALHEAFGQSCLESLALGVPVICLNWGGPALIVDDTCGYKVEPTGREETVRGFAAAIRQLHDEAAAGKDFSTACIERARAFQWRAMADQIEALYARILADGDERSVGNPSFPQEPLPRP